MTIDWDNLPPFDKWPEPKDVISFSLMQQWIDEAIALLNNIRTGTRIASTNYSRNQVVLAEMYNKYVEDIKRLKYIHNIEADQYKLAGYATFWFRKLKPLKPERNNQDIITVNESVAFILGCLIVGSEGQHRRKQNEKIFDAGEFEHFMQEVSFTLRYRPTSPQLLSLFFRALYMRYPATE